MFVRWVACWLCADEQSSQAAGLRRGSRPTRKLLARKAAHIREEGRTIHSRGRCCRVPFPMLRRMEICYLADCDVREFGLPWVRAMHVASPGRS